MLTLTGFLYLVPQVLEELDTSYLYTLGEVLAVAWLAPFGALVLSYPSGRLTTRRDRWLIIAWVFGTTVWQFVWLLFLPSTEGVDNVLAIWPDAGVAEVIDTAQRTFNTLIGAAIAVIGTARWVRAAPVLRWLLAPALAGALAIGIIAAHSFYRLITGEFMRPTLEFTAVVLFAVPLAFLAGMLRAQLARAGTADLIVALQRAPDASGLGALLAKTLHDPSLEVVYWLPGFETYVDADGAPVGSPTDGRVMTPILHDGTRVAALIHDPALSYEPKLLEVVCAAADVALERRRLQDELESRVTESAPRARGSSRPATPPAGRSNATCTTVPSSGWSRWRSRCA